MRKFILLLKKFKNIEKFELEFGIEDQVDFIVCDDEFSNILKEFNSLIVKDKSLQKYLKNVILTNNLQILDYLKFEKFLNFWFNVIDYDCFLPWSVDLPEVLANKIYSLLQAFAVMMLFFSENDPGIKSKYLEFFKTKASDIPGAVTMWFYWNESLVCEDFDFTLSNELTKILDKPTKWGLELAELQKMIRSYYDSQKK